MTVFVTYNIHYGIGIDDRLDIGRIMEAISDADIIGLQEAVVTRPSRTMVLKRGVVVAANGRALSD